MSLTLSVLTYRNQPPARAMKASFSRAGIGTIGRQKGNTLELPDPERVISRTHARVGFEAGAFVVTNTGQNPIDLNGRPLGTDERAQLASGDRLTIGDYVIECGIDAADVPAGFAGAANHAAMAGAPPEFAPAAGEESAFGIPLMGGAEPPRRPSGAGSSAPAAMLTPAGQQRDRVPGFREPLPPAAQRVTIPEDFDLLQGLEGGTPPTPSPARPPSAAMPAAPPPEDPFADAAPRPVAAPTPEPSAPARREEPAAAVAAAGPVLPAAPPAPPPPPPPARDEYAAAIRTFLSAAGVPELEARALADADFMRTSGELLREAVAGLLKALVARALTKGELRLDMTMLAATENNPLKFSPNACEALTHLLAPRPGSGYLPPLRALREAYQDLEAHNLAVMAGMRAALLGVLERFDPHTLEQRLTTHHVLDKLLPVNRKARMWDLVAEQHADLVREAQDEFDRIFGRAFREAYQEQVEKLRAAGRQTPAPP